MGHYLAEMWNPLSDIDIRLDYHKRCKAEIVRTIEQNQININDIEIGGKLNLYHNLYEPSKEPITLKEIQGHGRYSVPSGLIRQNLYVHGWTDLELTTLALFEKTKQPFRVFDIKNNLIRLNKKKNLIPFWKDIRYFEKLK